MLERTVSLEIDNAYTAIKSSFTNKGCKIISEQHPNKILFKQGSLWGISPSSAKKKIQVNLELSNSNTKITYSSILSSDWKNITLIGCVLAAVLVGICLWMGFDLSTFIVTHRHSFWSWLITVNGNVDLQVGQAFVNLAKTLATFLSVIILLEFAIAIYVHYRIDSFAQQILTSISSEI